MTQTDEEKAREILGVPAGVNYPSVPKLAAAITAARADGYRIAVADAAKAVGEIVGAASCFARVAEAKAYNAAISDAVAAIEAKAKEAGR